MRNLTAVIWKEYNHDISVKMSVCNVTMATKALKFGRIFTIMTYSLRLCLFWFCNKLVSLNCSVSSKIFKMIYVKLLYAPSSGEIHQSKHRKVQYLQVDLVIKWQIVKPTVLHLCHALFSNQRNFLLAFNTGPFHQPLLMSTKSFDIGHCLPLRNELPSTLKDLLGASKSLIIRRQIIPLKLVSLSHEWILVKNVLLLLVNRRT